MTSRMICVDREFFYLDVHLLEHGVDGGRGMAFIFRRCYASQGSRHRQQMGSRIMSCP
jgi:hypothetical protein